MGNRFFIILLIFVSLLPACRKTEEAYFSESSRKGTAEAPVKEVPKDILATQQAFSNVVKVVNPAVVNISTVSKKKLVQPFFEMSPFFEDFFGGRGGMPQYRRENSLGSGFIISKDGYIITNDHVVRDAESIQVTLSDEKTYKGKVVGGDPKTDIAVIKINANGDLPVAVLGDSDKLSVGQWSIAIGNPFGLNRTVTVGVISATGRSNMGIETYENFIQTDASINPGNSGGPLLNVYGEVIGINTAIVASGQGIGFAIPINMAKIAVPQLIKKGNVTRGWLGVSIQPVTEDLAQSFGLNKTQGALVSDVVPGSPAAKAGVRQGDIITGFAGKEIKSVQQLQLTVANTPVGSAVEIEVLREGQTKKLTVAPASADSAAALAPAPSEAGSAALGLAVADLPRELKQTGLQGVIVTDVEEGGLAAESGIQQGDVLVSVNQKKISGTGDYARAIKDAERKGSVALLVRRGNASIYFAMKIR
ncbi:periplasmic trypsin-like serine protease lipoprotein DegQ [Geotalea daltonii FRC-32]|uniref:Periplasmic trypsin-like serine protease lipoprotein DegQ n=1 Tax=Geotalea daltonii (strain DSM 22248 / JCM 15807 / FRC-32) TaxID=316067 RepID=B9M2K7_GEODF|nr:DegQ family serine endoprotease [Geotalea daltonii]ACM19386.1 periplasmic trypsin-like serine protease lipoprotein DegQ [Geotalea daltonii FRC-32]